MIAKEINNRLQNLAQPGMEDPLVDRLPGKMKRTKFLKRIRTHRFGLHHKQLKLFEK